eukprot:TRINITY_DN9227_c0_g1_i1.p1 TRINITY_DN9227_c0_g1~~TRINITY_DN9227_c0_g1_i1.p1  ORF type:complete len:522 (-),score=43.53 TRINITY_DN9227_c0_g1_i1:55-1620(-)
MDVPSHINRGNRNGDGDFTAPATVGVGTGARPQYTQSVRHHHVGDISDDEGSSGDESVVLDDNDDQEAFVVLRSLNTQESVNAEEGVEYSFRTRGGRGTSGQEQHGADAEVYQFPCTVADVFEYAAARYRAGRGPKHIHLKSYWRILLLMGMFYALPSIQFVLWQYWRETPESGVYCYFNFKCAKSLWGFDAANNIISNIGYIVGGVFFLAFVYATRTRRKRASVRSAGSREPVTGLHSDMSLYYCLGICTIYEGIFSALYHVCPSKLNFQFDVTFMILGSTFLFYTLFQKRHPLSPPGAIRTFTYLALVVFTSFLSLTNIPLFAFWLWVWVLMSSIMIPLSLQLYYAKRMPIRFYLRVNYERFWPISRPWRLFAIFIGNLFTWLFFAASCKSSIESGSTSNFPTFAVGVIIINTFVYLLFYIAAKIYYKEKIRWMAYPLFFMFVVFWALGIYYFQLSPTNKFLTPEKSAELNQPCYLFDYFDRHDLWHFLSAAGLVTWGVLVYILDSDTKTTPRHELAVF